MNEETLKDMPEYLKTLPKSIQDVVFDGVWEDRADEIAKKYSLNEAQTDSLINNVLFILIGLENPDNFLDTIITELNISRLLAEQITEDLEVRVFEYTVKSIENKEKRTVAESPRQNPAPSPAPEPISIKPTLVVENDIPEIRPEILPMVEPEEKVHIVEPPTNTNRVWQRRINLIEPEQKPAPVEVKPVQNNTQPLPQPPVFVPRDSTNSPEPVQKPVSVPRYTGESMITETTNKPAEPTKPPEPVPPIVKNYVVDPYREPIE